MNYVKKCSATLARLSKIREILYLGRQDRVPYGVVSYAYSPLDIYIGANNNVVFYRVKPLWI
jgi:hypothetical protein